MTITSAAGVTPGYTPPIDTSAQNISDAHRSATERLLGHSLEQVKETLLPVKEVFEGIKSIADLKAFMALNQISSISLFSVSEGKISGVTTISLDDRSELIKETSSRHQAKNYQTEHHNPVPLNYGDFEQLFNLREHALSDTTEFSLIDFIYKDMHQQLKNGARSVSLSSVSADGTTKSSVFTLTRDDNHEYQWKSTPAAQDTPAAQQQTTSNRPQQNVQPETTPHSARREQAGPSSAADNPLQAAMNKLLDKTDKLSEDAEKFAHLRQESHGGTARTGNVNKFSVFENKIFDRNGIRDKTPAERGGNNAEPGLSSAEQGAGNVSFNISGIHMYGSPSAAGTDDPEISALKDKAKEVKSAAKEVKKAAKQASNSASATAENSQTTHGNTTKFSIFNKSTLNGSSVTLNNVKIGSSR